MNLQAINEGIKQLEEQAMQHDKEMKKRQIKVKNLINHG